MRNIEKILFVILMISVTLLLSGCINNANTPTDYYENPNNTVEFTEKMAIEIAKNCLVTISSEFNEEECVPYEEVFYYYTFDACYTPDRKGISFEVISYYDSDNMTFSIPCEIVDSFLEKKFNTEANPDSIKYFNPDTNCYEFEQNFGETFYEITFVNKEQISENKYSFVVNLKHALSDDFPEEYHKYVIEFIGDDYKILSRKTEKTGDS